MSRIGRMPIEIPDGVTLKVEDSRITVKGAKGELSQDYLDSIVSINLEDKVCTVERKDESKQAKAMHGLYRKLIHNMVVGVSEGFSKVLLVNGVGYRAELRGEALVLNLGYSNPIEYPIPDGITVTVEGNNRIIVSGADRQQVGQISAEIRGLRPPEPYKGKGIRYENEYVRRKIGKTGIK
ncbi:MAG: 50S ribosomal protein L6 [Spirochaetaceae bacterium]|nr:MAG: 50S ribosomal protein L6 [Spirochaetaceae bacterium]